MKQNPAAEVTGPTLGRVVLAALLGASAGLFLSGYWLIDLFPADSRQLLFISGLSSIIAAVGYYFAVGRIAPQLRSRALPQRALGVVLGMVLGGFLFFAGTSQWQLTGRNIPFLLPRHEFRITALGAPAGTSLVWINTSLGDVSYDLLESQGWTRDADQMALRDPSKNQLSWSVQTGEQLRLVFQSTQPGGKIILTSDDTEQTIVLDGHKTTYEQTFVIPLLASRWTVLLLGLLNFVVIGLGLVLVGGGGLARLHLEAEMDDRRPAGQADMRTEGPLLLALMVVALLLRAFNLGRAYPAVDEYYHLIAADQLLKGAALDSVYQRGLWIVTVPVAIALRIVGHEVWAARAMGVLFNVLGMWPLYLLARKISRPVGVVACLLYATSPWIITFARVAREYAYYPFYFYWILLAMVSLIQAIPGGFHVRQQWRQILRWRILAAAALLGLTPVFALKIDWLSTFRTILIAYLVFGVFVLMRFDWKDKANWPYLAIATLIVLLGGWRFYSEQITKLLLIPRVNPVPLLYFFPNPPQQWYFERLVVLAALGTAVAIAAAGLHRQVNFVPLFVVGLVAAYVAVFSLFSKSFFHTRHLISTEFWFVVVLAMGLCWLWELLRGVVPLRNPTILVLACLVLTLAVFNPMQVVLPTVSNDPDMPISEDYMHDMSAVQTYLVGRVQRTDALVATVYGLYATWQGEPAFSEQYRITSATTGEQIKAIVQQHDSGWLVIDQIRLDLSALSTRQITSMPQMEYIGVFGDEYVWRWGESSGGPDAALPGTYTWIYH